MDEDLIFRNHIEIRAIANRRNRHPAMEWVDSLPARDRHRADAGMLNFDRTEAAGMHRTGRLEIVRGKRHRMLELKLTRGGTTGPQLRFLGVMRGRTFWAARGFSKTTRTLTAADKAAAEAILDQWRGPPDEGDPR
jgi:hypothetical protein